MPRRDALLQDLEMLGVRHRVCLPLYLPAHPLSPPVENSPARAADTVLLSDAIPYY